MLRKLILMIISVVFLTGCGASAPADPAENDGTALCRTDGAGVAGEPQDTPDSSVPLQADADEESACSAEYFVFHSNTNTLSDDQGLTLLYENQCLPAFSSPDRSREEWVTELLDNIARDFFTDSRNLYDYAQDFVSQNGTDYFYSYSNYQQLGVARHDEIVVSLISLNSLYSGGSHPNSVQTAYNLDITGRRVLRLEDVIAEGAAPELADLVRERIDEKFSVIDGGNGLFEDYGGAIDTSMTYGNMTPYWYLNDKGLVIFYNQYELGPYAAGIIKVELLYEELEGILLEEFYPLKHDGIPGDLILCEDADGSRIPITIEKDGQTLLVGVEGKVYQVQLSEVLWLEDTPIAQNLIFSALSLEEDDVLEITGGYTDEARSFAIEFVNGQGEQHIYYLHDDALSPEP